MADLDYVRVVGRFGIVVRDEATDDPNLEPDTVWCDAGTILFTPLITAVKVIDANPVPVTLGQSVIEGEIDADGYLSLRGTREIQFVDLGSTKVNPYIGAGKATHKVEFLGLTADGVPVNLPTPVNVRLSADMNSPMGTIDLTLVSPVPVAGGTAQVVGPAGPSAYEGWLAQGNTGTFDDFMTAGFADNESYVSALTSAQNAANSATAALASENAAASSASAAASSATDASGSASAASTSASNAADSATAAADSATSASGSASTATTKASEASTSATNAASSATAASNSATAADTSATNAATSATNASNSASSAGNSASTATTGANTATTKANEAAASASQAETAASGAVEVAVAGSLPQLYTNLITNPSFEVDTTGWVSGANATLSRVTTDSVFGSACARLVQNVATTSDIHASFATSGLTVGRVYTFSAWVKRESGTLGIVIQAGPGADNTGTFFANPQAWTRVSVTFTAKVTNPILYLYQGTAFNAGSTTGNGTAFLFDAAMLTEGTTLPPYFDGSTAGCYWTGTANASTSVKMVENTADLQATVRTDMSSVPVTNFIVNPSVSSTGGWSPLNSSGTLSTETDSGRSVGKFIFSAATAAVAGGTQVGVSGLTVGRRYTMEAMVKNIGGTSPGGYVIRTQGVNTNGTGTGNTTSYQKISASFTATTTSESLRIVNAGSNSVIGEGFYFHSVALYNADSGVTSYFDGDSKYAYWTGTPHASTSVYAPPQAEDMQLRRNVPVLYTNLITNPSFETSLTPMGPAGTVTATITKDSTKTFTGSSSIKVVSASSSNNSGVFHNTPRPNVSPNKIYTSSVYVNPDNAGEYKFEMRFWTGGSPTLISTHTDTKTLGVGAWTRFVNTVVAPSTASSVDFVVRMPDNSVAYVDALMLTETPHPVDYFDGSSPGCEWTGTPHASTSIKRFKSKQIDLNNVPVLLENLVPNPSLNGTSGTYGSVSGQTVTSNYRAYRRTATAEIVLAQGVEFFNVTPGQTFTAILMHTSKSATVNSRVVFMNAAGSSISDTVMAARTMTTAATVTDMLTGTVPANAVRCRLQLDSGTAAVDDYIEHNRAAFYQGVTLTQPVLFDGDDEGCYWTGTPGASTSVKKFPKRDDVVLTSRMPELARNRVANGSGELGVSSVGPLTQRWYSSVPGNMSVSKAASIPAGLDLQSAVQVNIISSPAVVQGPISAFPIDTKPGVYSFWVYSQAAATRVIQFSAQRFDAGLAYIAGIGNPATPQIPPNTWTRVTLRVAVQAAGSKGLNFFVSPANHVAGENIYIARAMLEEGNYPSEFFNGNTPGARWDTDNTGESIRITPSKQDYNLLTWLDAGRAQGVGSPEGVVTATVGTRYVDTAATNGAIEWIKASGTGNTGWKVVYGDTGWRNVDAGLLNGHTHSPNDGGGFGLQIRRSNNQVIIRGALDIRAATADIVYNLPAGFKPTTTNGIYEGLCTVSLAFSTVFAIYQLNQNGVLLVSPSTTRTNGSYQTVRFSVAAAVSVNDIPWPTGNLPGSNVNV